MFHPFKECYLDMVKGLMLHKVAVTKSTHRNTYTVHLFHLSDTLNPRQVQVYLLVALYNLRLNCIEICVHTELILLEMVVFFQSARPPDSARSGCWQPHISSSALIESQHVICDFEIIAALDQSCTEHGKPDSGLHCCDAQLVSNLILDVSH